MKLQINGGSKMTHDKTCTDVSRESTLTHVWSLILLKGHRTFKRWPNLLVLVAIIDASLMMYQMTIWKEQTTENKLGPFSILPYCNTRSSLCKILPINKPLNKRGWEHGQSGDVNAHVAPTNCRQWKLNVIQSRFGGPVRSDGHSLSWRTPSTSARAGK